jgi:hypothetical protein
MKPLFIIAAMFITMVDAHAEVAHPHVWHRHGYAHRKPVQQPQVQPPQQVRPPEDVWQREGAPH